MEELIDLYEEKSLLWNLFDKRDLRELATKEISEKLGIALGDIKAKLNSLRAQLGRELMKVRKTKSGQATNELYVSNWAHWDRLQFLAGVIQAAKSRDNLNSSENSKNSTSFEEDDSFLPEEDSFENETTCSKRVMVKNKKAKLSAAPYEEKKWNYWQNEVDERKARRTAKM